MPTWNISPEAAALHTDSLVCDMTLPWMAYTDNKEGILERFGDSGFDLVSLTTTTDGHTLTDMVKYIAQVKRTLEKRGDTVLVRRAADITAAKAQGKLAIILNFQGTNSLEASVEMIAVVYDLGVRQMLFTYNAQNLAGGGLIDDPDEGLTPFGISMVGEMNRLGMIVDCTHMGFISSMQAMELSRLPCLISHSNSSVIRKHQRNINDEQAKACAKTGGVIGMNGISLFLSDNGDASVESMMRHIDHLVELVGPEHVGIGLDYVYYEEQMMKVVMANLDKFPKGDPLPPYKYFAPEDLPHLTEALLRRGYAEDDIRGILGRNFLRVCTEVLG